MLPIQATWRCSFALARVVRQDRTLWEAINAQDHCRVPLLIHCPPVSQANDYAVMRYSHGVCFFCVVVRVVVGKKGKNFLSFSKYNNYPDNYPEEIPTRHF